MWVRPTGRTKTTQVLSFCLGNKRHNAGALSPIGNARLPVNRAPYAAVAGGSAGKSTNFARLPSLSARLREKQGANKTVLGYPVCLTVY